MKKKPAILLLITMLLGTLSCSDRVRNRNSVARSDTTGASPTDTSKTSGYFYHKPPQGY